MDVYPPSHLTLEESQGLAADFNKKAKEMKVSDEDLIKYIKMFFAVFRETIDKYFSELADNIYMYASYPFETKIVRIGNNGVIIGHKSSAIESVHDPGKNDS